MGEPSWKADWASGSSTRRRVARRLMLVVLLLALAGGATLAAFGRNRVSSWFVPVLKAAVDEPWQRFAQPPYLFSEADEAALSAARERIAEREGRARPVRLLDSDGEPLRAGVAVRYRLARHGFGFGSFDAPSPQLGALWGPVKNKTYALQTWPDLWRPEEGVFDFREAEVLAATAWHRAVGMTTAFHNVVWIIDKVEANGKAELRVPEDLRGLPFEAQRERILEWTRAAAEWTDGRFDVVNVYNEPLNAWTDPYGWGMERRREVLADVVRTFREHNATSEIQVSIGEAFTAGSGADADWLLSWMRAKELPVDRVALQLWCNGTFEFGDPMPAITLATFASRLRGFAGYGFPLDISEFQSPRDGSPRLFFHWTPGRQARWAEAVATVAFGTPGVASFTYFRSQDNFMIAGGLYDGTQRTSAADRLVGLIGGWHPRGEAVTDAEGRIDLPGFGGVYLVEPAEPDPGVRWSVDTRRPDRDEQPPSPLAARAEPRPAQAPASIRGLGPLVTAENFLAARVEPAPAAPAGPAAADRAQDALDRATPLLHRSSGEPRGFERVGGGVEITRGTRFTGGINGFCFDAVPDGARSLVLDLVVHDRGTPLCLNLFDRTRRYSDAALAPGAYRITVPIDAGSRPVLQLVPPIGRLGLFEDGDRDLPYATVHAARFEPSP